ncbi:MAG: hypothetical protein ACE5I7_17500 [Candidatus Binatia bacterium]
MLSSDRLRGSALRGVVVMFEESVAQEFPKDWIAGASGEKLGDC